MPPKESIDTSTDDVKGTQTEDVDYKALVGETEAKLEQTRATLTGTQKEVGELRQHTKQANEKFERLQRALGGKEDAAPPDPVESEIATLNQELDEYIQIAADHDKAGSPIPVTLKNAVNRISFQIKTLREHAEIKGNYKKLETTVNRLADPQTTMENMVTSKMDSHLRSALETMYGPKNAQVKNVQGKAVTEMIVSEIKDLKKNRPEDWDRVMRDERAAIKMVNWAIEQIIPPRARQIMDDDNVKRTPMTLAETYSAWKEAKQLEAKNPKAPKYSVQIREQIAALIYEKNAGKRGVVNTLQRGE